MAAGSDDAPLIVIVGETASGKSELAVKVAERFDGEIIAADSWTVYRDFDIGTAKPSRAERDRVPHHLLDIADPKTGFSAARYKQMAIDAAVEISSKGKLPIMVGGTGLYIDSVIFDYSFLPAASTEIREGLNRLTIDELLQKLDELAIDTSGIDLRNKRRLIRLIETDGSRPSKAGLRPNTLVLGLGVPRDELRSRVESRVDAMFAAGLEDEVRRLVEKYGWDTEPMKGIGYREFYDYFQSDQSLEQTRVRIINATMNLAKRQRTWFKRNQYIQKIDGFDDAAKLITAFLNTYFQRSGATLIQ